MTSSRTPSKPTGKTDLARGSQIKDLKKPFVKRIDDLLQLKNVHETVRTMYADTYERDQALNDQLFKIGFPKLADIDAEFESFHGIDLFDLTAEGETILQNTIKRYEATLAQFDKVCVEKINYLFTAAKTNNDRFKIFSKFFLLLQRPFIKQELKTHQETLLKIIEEDQNQLIQKYKSQLEKPLSPLLANKFRMPTNIYSLVWTEQILNNMKANMDKLKFILGENWSTTSKGKDLASTMETFSKFIAKNIEEIMTSCENKYEQRVDEKILSIRKNPNTNKLELAMNFNEENKPVIKAIRFLLNFNRDLAKKYYLKFMFKNVTWPSYAATYIIKDSIKTFNIIVSKLTPVSTKLLAKSLKDVYRRIESAQSLTWFKEDNNSEENRVEKFAINFASDVNALEEGANYILDKTTKISQIMEELETPGGTNFEEMAEKIKIIQETMVEFESRNMRNVQFFIDELNSKIENVLIEKLNNLIKLWAYEFITYNGEGHNKRNQETDGAVETDENGNSIATTEKVSKNQLVTESTIHNILVENQSVFLDPPVEHIRLFWLSHLQSIISTVCSMPRIKRENDSKEENFGSLLFKLDTNALMKANEVMNEFIEKAKEYVRSWQAYQSLWDIDIKKVQEFLGNNAQMWETVLNEIKAGKKKFDSKQSSVNFGPISIDFKFAKKKISNKYDGLHKEILSDFGKTLNVQMNTFFEDIRSNREKVEHIDLTDSFNIISAIAQLNHCRDNIDIWERSVEKFRSGEQLLVDQRFLFPANWKEFSLLESEWKRFHQAFMLKKQQYESEFDTIRFRLCKEEEGLLKKVRDIENVWKTKRPFSGNLHPKEAIEVIDSLERTINDNRSSFEKLNSAKELLGLPPIDLSIINSITEESSSLKELWIHIQRCWQQIDKIFETPIKVSNPIKIGQTFDEILELLNGMPKKFLSFEALVVKKKEIAGYKKTNKLLKDLKTDAIKDQHWEQILQKVKLVKKYKNLTFGDLHKHNIVTYEKMIMDIVVLAQGELVLESMLKKIKEFWNNEEFILSKYQEKCMLIKGWDELMTKIEDDLGHLNSMKLSQHFKAFEEEVKSWSEKLVMLQNVLDVWVNVQRKWVYLEGIFFGSSDISQQLPNEYAKFRSIDNDFTSLMKKTASKLKILDVVLNIPNLQKSLQILYDSLEKIQKALSEYLETQRQAFARFYFVGDEDLLEIIGNSKDVTNIQKYFSKMFAGINLVENDEGGILLTGMRSRENETVAFIRPFKISDKPKINEWLTELENQMRLSLASDFEKGLKEWGALRGANIRALVDMFSAQDVLISFQTFWTFLVEDGKLSAVVDRLVGILDYMAEEVLTDLPKLTRSKYEQLITELVHKRDVTRMLLKSGENPQSSFSWSAQMRYYNEVSEEDPSQRLKIRMGNSEFPYGYEYLGITDKLVQTPLTDKCYFTLTQAMWLRMGGAPFGPAGTGKTESVKALGNCLGRFVLVFNCDETFNFKAMGRIFIGLCQVGAWGCFDEFNRLEERILSAVSQQILTIQSGLREKTAKIELMSRDVKLNPNMGIFVTMNPGYAGRSNLPENLKQLFRQMAMIHPDRELIAQVMLFSQGFKSAEQLSGKVVSLFELCKDQLSSQPHYDFGLRALKSVLNSAGNLKRRAINEDKDKANSPLEEQRIILRSFCDTVVPKLISEDAPLLQNLIKGVFPEAEIPQIEDVKLREAISEECSDRHLLMGDRFVEKVLQLNQILKLQHGVMLVGPTGCGKTAAWKVLLAALSRIDASKGESYVIDPKAISKDDLYGKLDNTTMEWTDGIFTHTLRKIGENAKGESGKRHWIIFDGDVDPEWAENLNSVLDDNKLLTLPNGERISIPSNVKIMFEVESLKYATLATVSRCGMVWFSDDVLNTYEIFYHYLQRLRQEHYDQEVFQKAPVHEVRERCVSTIEPLFFGTYLLQLLTPQKQIKVEQSKSLVWSALALARPKEHVMEFSDIRALEALFALLRKGIERVVEYNEQNIDFPLESTVYGKYIKSWCLLSLNWAFVGDLKLGRRAEYFQELVQTCPMGDLQLPVTNDMITLIDYTIEMRTGEWVTWKSRVPTTEVDENQVTNADTIITTVDTLRHQEILCSWLLERRPFIICGPPGSGKTMTLMSTLKGLLNYDMIFVNFSSSTNPQLILKQFEHYCEYVKSNAGITLKPRQINKHLVVFCDEINLPDEDKYGTQFVITFLRQMTEQHGFWRSSDKQWVNLERIQFVGACNPPTDAGRHPLAPRFLRHCPLMLVDFPGYDSLTQIYGSFNHVMLAKNPELRDHWKELTRAMVDYYTQSQKRFTSDMQAHYIYSPRELTRWKYAINEALPGVNVLEDLVRLWAHEALRLFEDRLVTDEEKEWCQVAVDKIAKENFPAVQLKTVLQRPILFSTYLTKTYKSVELEELRQYVIAKLRTFNEEEYSIQLVVFDSVLDHIVRIDRVLRQPIGHVLLVGASGVGKTTLSRFVAWMNGLSVFQIKAGRNYTLADFDANLREVMKRAGCKLEKICFIFDESNVLSVAFLERMNALLASGEVPGLFEGEEYSSLINSYRENQTGKRLQSDEEIYANFTRNVQRNLHVVFTMNPASPDFQNRAASSPAIFNRCVIDWFGDWSEEALFQVARELTEKLEVPNGSLTNPSNSPHDIVVQLIVRIHNSVKFLNDQLQKGAKRFNYLTPRDFLDFIKHILALQEEKHGMLIEQEKHLKNGLDKLKETESSVFELDQSLNTYKVELDAKEIEANAKMELMVNEQKIAEENEAKLSELLIVLAAKKEEIGQRSSIVQIDLDKAGPALEAAKKAVSAITAKELNDIRVLNNPPVLIKLTLTAICLLLTNQEMEWKEIQSTMKGKDFIGSIMNMNVDNVKTDTKNKVIKKYLKAPEWNIEKIYSAYKAAGILAQWLESQLSYADILTKVDPLRREIATLESEMSVLVADQTRNQQALDQTQKTIETYKTDYTDLISKVQNIKTEMQKVNTKVQRSKQLLTNLSSEKHRWTESSQGFADQLSSMTGDVIICAAFLAYCGFFDQLYRNLLTKTWRGYLQEYGLKFKPDLSISEYLSTTAEKMTWQAHKLPNDDLCNQNAIIIKRHNRYPLIIDPSGQAIEFVLSYFAERKIEKTSFDDPAFIKTLEKCLRFGLPVLVQNVEKIEPMLNSVLNKEVVKQGGRKLVRVGDQEIDFNENFSLYMITRNSEAKFSPDLCSRVTFVNFTVTQSSLENQCINIYLKNERPDTEKDRIMLLKLQGEFLLKIRELEDDLLTKISEQTGSILENAALITTLDNLKTKADEIMQQMRESGETLRKVEAVTEEYRELSFVSAKLYFVLLSFSSLNVLYQFSFQFYMKVLLSVLNANDLLTSIPKDEHAQRIKTIREQLFVSVFRKLEIAILEKDKLLISLRFCQLCLGQRYSEYFKLFIEPPTVMEPSWHGVMEDRLTKQQLVRLESLGKNSLFNNLHSSLKTNSRDWLAFANGTASALPSDWLTTNDQAAQYILKAAVAAIIKPTATFDFLNSLIASTLGEEFTKRGYADLKELIERDSDAGAPIFLACAPGFDPSYKIDTVSKTLGKKYEAIAIGSAEGFVAADKTMERALKAGGWVVLKNVHLACSWLAELEQKLLKSKPHRDFRIFLVSEFNDKLPTTLLRQSLKMIFELPEGIKANVTRMLSNVVSAEKMDAAPRERGRFYFQAVWLHAVIMERLRYTPIGWSKAYEFSEADLRCSLEIVDQFLRKGGSPLAHIPALRAIITDNVYGGKIDNEFDLKILRALVHQYISNEFFDDAANSHALIRGDNNQTLVPNFSAATSAEFATWAENLRAAETPVWAGLPLAAEEVLLSQRLDALSARLLSVQDAGDEEVMAIREGEAGEAAASQLRWLRELAERCRAYLTMLPRELPPLARNAQLITDPLFRFLERETTLCSQLLSQVRANLTEVEAMAEGRLQPLQELKNLARALHAGEVPKEWARRYPALELNAALWLQDFRNRLEQLGTLARTDSWQRKGVTLGLMLFPEAFLTATRQFVAQATRRALDELELQITLAAADEQKQVGEDSFLVRGLRVEGVNWTAAGLRAERDISFALPPVKFTWAPADREAGGKKRPLGEGELLLPLYLSSARRQLLTSVRFEARGAGLSTQLLYQRGVALIAWSL